MRIIYLCVVNRSAINRLIIRHKSYKNIPTATSANLNIPLSLNQIIDLIKQLPKTQRKKLVSIIQEEDEFIVPQWHKKIVLERIKNERLSDALPWKDVRKKLKFKSK